MRANNRFFFGIAIAIALGGRTARAAEPPPRVVVLMIVDQLPVRLWDRVLPVLPPGGFRRLVEGGASFIGRYAQANTSTAPGHALVATGANPARSGIVGNSWWSRLSWKQVYCVEDPAFAVLGRAAREHEGTSPLTLRVTGVADALRTTTLGRANIVTMSWKDRGAILLGGMRPTAAVWFDLVAGAFATSTYYAHELPGWVAHANELRPASRTVGKSWSPRLDAKTLARLAPAAKAGVGDYDGLGREFPHPIRSVRALGATPLANELLTELALDGLAATGMGKDEVPDLFAVSFSANDFVGHIFGPDSAEAIDAMVSLDRQVARLLGALDKQVGAGRYAVVVTSDHGGAGLPEQVGGDSRPVRMGRDADVAVEIEQAVAHAVGPGFHVAIQHPHVWLRADGAAAARLPEALTAARGALGALPGVERVLSAADLIHIAPGDGIAQAVARNWDADRAGDLFVVLGLGSVFEEEMTIGKGTGHGSPRLYDQEVPLVFYGARVAPRRERRAEPVPQESVAPTLSALLGVPPPPAAEAAAITDALR